MFIGEIKLHSFIF